MHSRDFCSISDNSIVYNFSQHDMMFFRKSQAFSPVQDDSLDSSFSQRFTVAKDYPDFIRNFDWSIVKLNESQRQCSLDTSRKYNIRHQFYCSKRYITRQVSPACILQSPLSHTNSEVISSNLLLNIAPYSSYPANTALSTSRIWCSPIACTAPSLLLSSSNAAFQRSNSLHHPACHTAGMLG